MNKPLVKKKNKRILLILLDFSPVLGAIFGLLLGALFVTLWGVDPITFFIELFKGAFGSAQAMGNTLNRATPLLLIGAGTAIAFQAGANNIGQEGQLFIGGFAAAFVALIFSEMPVALGIPAVLVVAFLFGMLYAGIAVLFRLFKGVNELLITLLFNYIGVLFVSYIVSGPMGASGTVSFPQTDPFGAQFLLVNYPDFGFMHAGIFIAVVITILAGYYLWFTPSGLRLRTAGLSPLASRSSGNNPTKIFVMAMMVSGGMCALAGAIEVIGTTDSLRQGFGTNLGFDGLAVALLGNTNPFGVLPAGLFFGALRNGMQAMQRSTGIPSVVLDLIKGSIMIFIMVGAALKIHVNASVQKASKLQEASSHHTTVSDDEAQSKNSGGEEPCQ